MSSDSHSSTAVANNPHFDPELGELAGYSGSKLGMWLFLATEIVMFGGLFVLYALYRSLEPSQFAEDAKQLNRLMGAANTVVLICSSLTMALAVNAIQRGDRKKLNLFMGLSFLGGLAFMVVKYFEYSHKYHVGTFPMGKLFHGMSSVVGQPDTYSHFFPIYFMTTGLHGLHVLIGMGFMATIMIYNAKGEFSAKYYTPVEICGLLWHLVDLVWIFLFPLLYLI